MAAPLGLQGCLLILPLVWLMTGSGFRATANPDHVFTSATGLGEVEAQHLIGQVGQTLEPDSEDEQVLLCPGIESSNGNQEGSEDILIDFPYPNAPIQKVKIVGSTVFSAEDIKEEIERSDEINQRIQKLEGRSLTWDDEEELIALAIGVKNAISDLYIKEGYITSQAESPTPTPDNGVIGIQVIEGSLAEIQIKGTRNLTSYICDRIQLGAGTPLNTAKLEDQLRLLRNDPLIDNIEANLQPAGRRDQSILSVLITLTDPFEANISVDNYSPPSVGSERLGVRLRHRNLTDIGDEISLYSSSTATGGTEAFELSYRLPLNPMNGTLQLRVAPNQNEVTLSEFEEFDIRGETELYEISYRQPLVRSIREEFALSVGFTYQNGQTFIFDQLPTPFGIGPDEDGISRTSVIQFGQEYLRRDPQGAWLLRSQFSLGLDLFNATTNEGSIPDGQFFSWLGQVQRVQRLGDDHLLIIQGNLQLTPGSLLPAQQFVIGGGQSVRGYRQNARSGDNGFRFSIEDRIAIERDAAGTPILLLAPFLDMGLVWNHPDNPNSLSSQRFLAGLGMGLIIEPESPLSFRFDYGIPLVVPDERGVNAQDVSLYFSVRYEF